MKDADDSDGFSATLAGALNEGWLEPTEPFTLRPAQLDRTIDALGVAMDLLREELGSTRLMQPLVLRYLLALQLELKTISAGLASPALTPADELRDRRKHPTLHHPGAKQLPLYLSAAEDLLAEHESRKAARERLCGFLSERGISRKASTLKRYNEVTPKNGDWHRNRALMANFASTFIEMDGPSAASAMKGVQIVLGPIIVQASGLGQKG